MPHTVIESKHYPVSPDDYQILEEVGQGVSATVYTAICKPFNETVAIKSLDLEKCNSNLDDIRKEAQMMSLISHPNVVRAYCSFVNDRFLWVVMPYMAGGSCLHIMKSHHPDGFQETIIASVLKETLKALDYLHHHGHIHRDVKAGNILIDASGNVKLADFGVSACMFDTGDRQRARNTFCGTPCWMAPEVMEQLHGYDFKADIWSFGITALELAHGHAPFSKFPPMKVLLMTLQNAPPGLDQDRDRKFSKAMKEMIAMCLVKDPAKRPTAEKLLKHAFFKQAKGPEYIANAILKGLPPLGERVKLLKAKDEARLAAQKPPLTAQEIKSQNEYKRGVSDWDFNVDDIKKQAALLPDFDFPSIKEEEEKSLHGSVHGVSHFGAKEPEKVDSEAHSSAAMDSALLHTESAPHGDSSEVRKSLTVPSPASSHKPPALQKTDARGSSAPATKKEAKHIGRFEVIEGDQEEEEDREETVKSSGQGSEKKESSVHGDRREDKDRSMLRVGSNTALDREKKAEDNRDRSRTEREKGEDSARERTRSDREREHHRKADRDSRQLSSASLPSQSSNGAPPVKKEEHKKDLSDSSKGHEKVHRRGRFVVEGSEPKTDVPLPKKILLPTEKLVPSQPVTPGSHSSHTSHVPVISILPHLQTLMKQTNEQQEAMYQIMGILLPNDGKSLFPRSSSEDGEAKSERERELIHQVLELTAKVHVLEGEMQSLKLRNSQLERQLNVFFNKEEEERIRQEEAAKDDN